MEDNRRDRSHNLYRLNDLSDYKVADHDPDIRGWEVKSMEGSTIGKVKDLVVDKEAEKVRYMDIHLYDKIYNSEKNTDMHLLVPIGAAALHESKDDVILDKITKAEVVQEEYPLIVGNDITATYEDRLREYYGKMHQTEGSDARDTDKNIVAFDKNDKNSYYNQDYFDKNRLYRHRS